MPLKEYNTKADFDNDYVLSAGWTQFVNAEGTIVSRPLTLNYHRSVMLPHAQALADKLVEFFGWPTDTNILIVGAGYAWTAEILEQQYGYSNIVTTDISPWIQASQDTSDVDEIDAAIVAAGLDPSTGEGAEHKARLSHGGNRRQHSRVIQNEDLATAQSRNRVRQILGNIDVGITEDVLPTLQDSEIVELADRVDRINNNIDRIHVVSPRRPNLRQDPVFNWKTLAEWKQLLPSDTFLVTGLWEVL